MTGLKNASRQDRSGGQAVKQETQEKKQVQKQEKEQVKEQVKEHVKEQERRHSRRCWVVAKLFFLVSLFYTLSCNSYNKGEAPLVSFYQAKEALVELLLRGTGASAEILKPFLSPLLATFFVAVHCFWEDLGLPTANRR